MRSSVASIRCILHSILLYLLDCLYADDKSCIYQASVCSSFVMFVSFPIKGDLGIGYVQIGVKADWRGIQGRLVLFVGNKHTGSLSNVRAAVLPPSHLRFQSPPIPDTIPPRAQVSFSSYTCVCILRI